MQITYHGAEMIKIVSGQNTLIFNPISKDAKLKASKHSADIIFISAKSKYFAGLDNVKPKSDKLFVIDGPGEYEINSIFVKATESKTEFDSASLNTIYSVKLEDVNIVFLGALSDPKPNMEFAEDLDSVDVLFVPIGSKGVLSPSEAHKIAVSLEAKLIVPIHYEGIEKKDILDHFEKEFSGQFEKMDKLSIKKKDIQETGQRVVVLS